MRQDFTINVWAGIVGDCLVGTYDPLTRLKVAVYREFISDTFPDMLEDVLLLIRSHMWFMHDGYPARFSLIFRYAVAYIYHDRG